MAMKIMPDLPYEILAKIVKLVVDDRWWLLGPILRAGKRGRYIVYCSDVLKDALILGTRQLFTMKG